MSAEFKNTIQLIPFQGRSMAPSLTEGDRLVVAPLGGGMPRMGDILLRNRGGTRIVAHRVVGVDEDRGRVRTRGDNCPFADGWWPVGESIGRVSAVRRDGILMAPPPPPPAWRRGFAFLMRLVSAFFRRVRAGRRGGARRLRLFSSR